MDTILLKR